MLNEPSGSSFILDVLGETSLRIHLKLPKVPYVEKIAKMAIYEIIICKPLVRPKTKLTF